MSRPQQRNILLRSLRRVLIALALIYLIGVAALWVFQRRLMYHPTHEPVAMALTEWMPDGQYSGYVREGSGENVWLFLNGNAGQASRFTFAADLLPRTDKVYFLEYPGFGARPGSPSMATLNAAAEKACGDIRRENPGAKLTVIGVSLGSGPAAHLGSIANPPERIVLIVPFGRMSDESQYKYPYLPARWLVRDDWDNIASLRNYRGRLQIFAERDDLMIPVKHARALHAALPQSEYTELPGGHGDWKHAIPLLSQ
ncbi:MAG TPA: hypothetical protein PKI32_06125 [Opitutales bacterium]|nr:hypothetical protein [Opitutales bacterium]